MFMLKKGHQPGVNVPLRALFLVLSTSFGHNNDLFQDTELKKIFTEVLKNGS